MNTPVQLSTIPPAQDIELTVVMPALNEQDNIVQAICNTLKALDDQGIGGEIVVVNDGSTDRTGELVSQMQGIDSRIRIITHDRPMGVGASFTEGVKAAHGDCVCMLPGDNENDPWDLFRYFPLMQHVDMVIPFVYNKGTRSVFRNMLSHSFRMIVNATFSVNFNYTNGTVIYRTEILKDLPEASPGFFFQTDILIRLARRNYLFAEVPYRLYSRPTRPSNAVSLKSLRNVMKGYLKLVWAIYFKKTNRAGERNKGGVVPSSRTAERFASGLKQASTEFFQAAGERAKPSATDVSAKKRDEEA